MQGLWEKLLRGPLNANESWFPLSNRHYHPSPPFPGSAQAPRLIPSVLLALTQDSFIATLEGGYLGLSWCCWVRGAPGKGVYDSHSSLVIGDTGSHLLEAAPATPHVGILRGS